MHVVVFVLFSSAYTCWSASRFTRIVLCRFQSSASFFLSLYHSLSSSKQDFRSESHFLGLSIRYTTKTSFNMSESDGPKALEMNATGDADNPVNCPPSVNEKALVRKMDFKILPMLFIIYVSAFLDRQVPQTLLIFARC